MPDGFLGDQGATLLTAIVIVAIALLVLTGIFWLLRKRSSATFIRGGRARQPRLAVLDAAAVDTRRRIVLIRRDDVEHLVMIGGPTDVVIESRIVSHGEPAQPGSSTDNRPVEDTRAPDRIPPAQLSNTELPTTGSMGAPPRAAIPVAAGMSAAGSVQAQAADILETARARVFDDPGSGESEIEDLTLARQSTMQTETEKPAFTAAATRPGPEVTASPEPAVPLGYAETLTNEDNSQPEPATTSATDKAQAIDSGPDDTEFEVPLQDFESVLAAELSEDLMLGTFDASAEELVLAEPDEAQPPEEPPANTQPDQRQPEETQSPGMVAPGMVAPGMVAPGMVAPGTEAPDLETPDLEASQRQSGKTEAPEVKPESPPSRDSLEAEMERLLGDLSRKG